MRKRAPIHGGQAGYARAVAFARLAVFCGVCTLGSSAIDARAQAPGPGGMLARGGTPSGEVPRELQGVGVDEHLLAKLPLDARFLDHRGRRVRLGDLFDGKRPVLLNLVYHSCPMLCSMVLDSTITSLGGVPWSVGKEFTAIAISIDPRDTPERAAKKRASVMKKYGRAADWHFLVGDEANIQRVTRAVGFNYHYDARQEQYAHPAVVTLVTPAGRIARYLYGLSLDSKDVRLGLLEASQGRSVSTLERVVLYCYHYDPQGGTYVIAASRVMQLGGALTALLLGGFLFVMWRRELKKRSRLSPSDTESGRASLQRAETAHL